MQRVLMSVVYRTLCLQDGNDGFFINSDSKAYWVSFLDGMQRVLLFTDDPALAINAQEVILYSTPSKRQYLSPYG